MIKTYFVTGTDTSVGKTLASCALLQAASKFGYNPVGYKPVSSGGKITSSGLRNNDALALQANSYFNLSYDFINPISFQEEAPPNIISKKIGKPIEFSLMSSGLKKLQLLSKWIIIEGAGGWFTPLSMDKTYADWVLEHRLSVILVVAIKLGCINHALLTAKSILSSGLSLLGWIANEIENDVIYKNEYLLTLDYMIEAPCLGVIPYLGLNKIKLFLGDYLNLSLLI
ncbi:ATP-dependent dethiobiotin synthetase BioD 1 [Candidatus Providencia siddallii]|uniref:ATP-dependent dethiobiotin synthetase BioD n=1 Tax=Candidatus Providencia siddallii TaxID=1715285 RepID=A0A0M6WAG3_9GAMM|nr:ATP-dependent dethiobiotin synthetase BioD 1 [Candidatus Providencia siddallii]